MSAITISSHKGSFGCQIANIVADSLGYKLVWNEPINEAAQRAGAPEVALAAFDELGLFRICPSSEICQAYHRALNEILVELAEKGSIVIFEQAGQVILGNRSDTFHVRLVAPKSIRIERIAQRMGITAECARAQIEASDRYRSTYLKRYYQANWDDPSFYHLVINTIAFEPDQAADIICRTFQAHFIPMVEKTK